MKDQKLHISHQERTAKSLGIQNVDNEIRSKPNIFIKDSDAKQLTYRTWKEAMDFFRISGSTLAKGINFIDSFKFMASSLDSLVANLSLLKLKETEKVFKTKSI